MVTAPRTPAGSDPEACRRLIEALLADPGAAPGETLGSFPPETVEHALKALLPRGAVLGPILAGLAGSSEKALRKVARRIRYRLETAGVTLPADAPTVGASAPAWTLREAWASPVDGTGSRALWLLAEGSYGEWLRLSLVLNDQVGILDSAGGPIPKKRIAAERQHLESRAGGRWIPLPPDYARGLIAETVGIHRDRPLPAEFLRWRDWLVGLPIARPLIYEWLDPEAIRADPTLLDHSGELLAQGELAGWFLEPDTVQSFALELEEARASRLVLSDTQKAEREAAILARAADTHFTGQARERWRGRLEETAYFFRETDRHREAEIAFAAALALADSEREPRHQPFCLTLVRRSLEVAAQVQAGKLSAEAASRLPRRPGPAGARIPVGATVGGTGNP